MHNGQLNGPYSSQRPVKHAVLVTSSSHQARWPKRRALRVVESKTPRYAAHINVCKHESQVPHNGRPKRTVFIITTRSGARGESFKSPSDFIKIDLKCPHYVSSARADFLKTSRLPLPYCYAFNSSKVCTKIWATGIVFKILSWI